MSPRAHRWLRILLGLAAGGLVALAAVTLWLLRDPLPRMEERRSTLAAVEEGPPRLVDGMVTRAVRLEAESGLAFDVLVRAPGEGPSASAPPDISALPDTSGLPDTSALPGTAALPDTSGLPDTSILPDSSDLRDTYDPQEASARARRPLYLLIGGYRTGERAALLVGDTDSAVVAAMGYPYDGPIDLSRLEILPHLLEIRRALLDTPPAIQLALDYLLRRPDVDPRRVELVGVSFGAFFAPSAAALDSRITRLWIVHGAARPGQVLDHGLERWISYDVPRALVAAAANVIFAGPLLAPERWLPDVAPRPVIVISARNDEDLPPDAVEALYESAREPKEQIWLEGPHVHPQRPDVVQRIMDVVLERAAEDGRVP